MTSSSKDLSTSTCSNTNNNPPSLYDTSASSISVGKSFTSSVTNMSGNTSDANGVAAHASHHSNGGTNKNNIGSSSSMNMSDRYQYHKQQHASSSTHHGSPPTLSSSVLPPVSSPLSSPSQSSSSNQRRQQQHDNQRDNNNNNNKYRNNHPVVTSSSSYSDHRHRQRHSQHGATDHPNRDEEHQHQYHSIVHGHQQDQRRFVHQGPPRLSRSMDEYNLKQRHRYAESDPGGVVMGSQMRTGGNDISSSPPSSPWYSRQRIEQHQFHRRRQLQNQQQQMQDEHESHPSEVQAGQEEEGMNQKGPSHRLPPISYSYSSNDVLSSPSTPMALSPRNLSRHDDQHLGKGQQGQTFPKTMYPYAKIEHAHSDVGPIRHDNRYGRQQNLLPSSSDHSNSHGNSVVETPPRMNVKELRNQLWNDQEILRVHSKNDTDSKGQEHKNETNPRPSPPPVVPPSQLPSPPSPFSRQHQEQHRQHPMTRQYGSNDDRTEGNSAAAGTNDPCYPAPGSSDILDAGSTGKFHSKFYDAALAARMRGKVGGVTTGSPLHDSTESFTSPLTTRSDNAGSIEQLSRTASSHSLGQSSAEQIRTDAGKDEYPRHPTLKQSPSRGRSMGPSCRSRKPSPLIQERIRSLSQEPSSDRGRFQPQDRVQSDIRQRIDGRSRDVAMYHDTSAGRAAYRGRNSPVPPGFLSQSYDAAFSESYWKDSEINDSGHITEHSMLNNSQSSHGQQSWQKRVPARPTRPSPTSHSNLSRYGQMPSLPRPPTKKGDFLDRNGDQNIGGKEPSQRNEKIDESAVKLSMLVAKLSSVNRANPEEALAQIDSILRQESLTKGRDEEEKKHVEPMDTGTQQKMWNGSGDNVKGGEEASATEGEDIGMDDDDSDVSSITNPTFQEGKKHEHVRVVMHSEWMHPKGYQYEFQHQREGVAKIGTQPSTSSFRRPRPSHLENYGMHGSLPNDEVVKSIRSGMTHQQLNSSPPMQIAVRDSPVSGEPQNVTVPAGDNLPSNASNHLDENSSSNISTKYPVGSNDYSKIDNVNRDAVEETRNTFRRRSNVEIRREMLEVDGAVSDKSLLAQKIRVWDSMSNGAANATSGRMLTDEDEYEYKKVSQMPPPPANNARRHPWEGKLPKNQIEKIEVRNTSMTEEMGIEAELKARGLVDNSSACSGAIYSNEADLAASDASSRPSQMSQRNEPFQVSRRIIKERSEGYLPVDPTYDVATEEKKVEERVPFPEMKPLLDETVNSSQQSIFENDHVEEGIPQFDPRLSQPRRMTLGDFEDHKDDAHSPSPWIPLPPSSFFPETNQSLEPLQAMKSSSDSIMKTEKSINDNSNESGSNFRGNHRSVAPSTTRTRYDGQFTYPSSNIPNEGSFTPSNSNPTRVGPTSSGPVDLDDSVTGTLSTHTGRVSRLTAKVDLSKEQNSEINDSTIQDLSFPGAHFDDSALSQSEENGAIEVALIDESEYKLDSSTESLRSRFMAPPEEERRMSCMAPIRSESWGKPKEKRRGLLRAFIEKSKVRKRRGETAATIGQGFSSVTNQSTASHATASGASSLSAAKGKSSAQPTLRLIPAPPGVLDREPRSIKPIHGRGGLWNDRKKEQIPGSSRILDNRKARAIDLIDKYYEDE